MKYNSSKLVKEQYNSESKADAMGFESELGGTYCKQNATTRFNKREKGKKAKEKSRYQQESYLYGEW